MAGTGAAPPGNNLTLLNLQEYAGVKRCYHHLIDITQSQQKVRMEEDLVNHVNNTILSLEKRSGREIELMYIGKANVNKNGDHFNHMDPRTWTTNGIASRWNDHKVKCYAKDGMVVLCAFTEDHLPAGSRRSQEYLAIAMEQRLIHHFQIFDTRKVLVNESFNQGKTTEHTKDAQKLSISIPLDKNADLDLTWREPIPKPKYCAYVIYMTFTYLPPKVEWKALREKQKTAQREQAQQKKQAKQRAREHVTQLHCAVVQQRAQAQQNKAGKKKDTSENEELRKLFHTHKLIYKYKHKSLVILHIIVHVITFCY